MSDSDAPLKIVINGQEFDETEANDLIETGRKTREYEQKWNTPLDKVWPEFGKKSEYAKQLETELEQAKSQLSEYTSKKEEGTNTPQDALEAKEAAKKLGLAFNDDLEKAGYIKKDDLDSWYSQKEEMKRASDAVLAEADKLEKDINGSDGRPKFKKQAVLAYASTYQIPSLQEAYEQMWAEELAPWKDAQIQAQKAKSLKTLGANGDKSPKQTKVDDNNLKEQLQEALWGNQE